MLLQKNEEDSSAENWERQASGRWISVQNVSWNCATGRTVRHRNRDDGSFVACSDAEERFLPTRSEPSLASLGMTALVVACNPSYSSDCATSKTRRSQERSDLRNSTVDEGRPLEPTYRSRTQITFRCCVLTDVVVSGEGKGPEAKFGSDDFQEEDRKGTTVIVSKIAKTMSKPR